MAWTAPRTWVAGDVLTAAQLNEQVKNNELILITPLDVLGNLSPDIETSSVTSNQNNLAITVTTGTLVFTGASAIDITGIVAPATAGKLLSIVNRGSGTHTLKDQVTSTAANRFDLGADVALATDDSIVLVYENSRWRAWCKPPSAAVSAPDVQRFTSSGTWTKPTGADAPISVYVLCVGGGGGGGSGEGGAGGFRVGGFGGGGGGISTAMFQASTLGSTEAVTIGAAGSAGSGTASATGVAGGAGGDTTFGGHLKGGGGSAGAGGTGASNPPDCAAGTGQWVPISQVNEGKGRGATSSAIQDSSWGAGGGGRGGCISGGAYMGAGDRTVTAGGAVYATIRAAGSAGTNVSSAGGAGTAAVDGAGAGGGGGGANTGGTSLAGGAGGNFGGGGGGSGAGSATSAAGGAGAAGYCLVISFP